MPKNSGSHATYEFTHGGTHSSKATSTNNKSSAGTVRIVYHANTNDTDYFVYGEQGMVEKWKTDKSTPLVDVLANWEVYVTQTKSNTGIASQASKQLLEEGFGTSNQDKIIETILNQGKVMHGPSLIHRSSKEFDQGYHRG
ncbi:hypothetical protein HK098_002958 [Nowakowskiella sp. JEL0407]|nr:hypothetical protein HK098_002958 [Nowakowskiella sp. JEL0407]